MNQASQSKSLLTYFISIFSLFVVGITTISVIFPALIISNFGIHSGDLEIFEIGNNASMIFLCNIILIGFGIAYYKNKLPSKIQSLLFTLLHKQISKKTTIIVLLVILLPYVILSTPELFLDEASQAPDYEIFLAAKEIFPFGKTKGLSDIELSSLLIIFSTLSNISRLAPCTCGIHLMEYGS